MGITVCLVKESGEVLDRLEDPDDFLKRNLELLDPEKYPLLTAIDPYGDAVFNRRQMPQFVREWHAVRDHARGHLDPRFLDGVENLARACEEEPHRYLKFIGD